MVTVMNGDPVNCELGVAELDRVDHVAIAVDDIDQAVDWYQKMFTCRVVYRDSTWAFLEFQNMKLALVVSEQHPPHIAFVTPRAGEFGPLSKHRDGTVSTYVRDTSGNAIELLAEE